MGPFPVIASNTLTNLLMKTFLIAAFAFLSLIAASPSVFAIDDVVHDVVDAATGRQHHRDYYNYDNHRRGYYGTPTYRYTRTTGRGSHRRHHSRAAGLFDVGHDQGHGHGHDDHH